MGREERCKQITLASVGSARSVSATLGLPPLTGCVLSLSTLLGSRLLCQELSEAGPGLYALPRSKPLSSGTWILHKGTDFVGPVFVPFLGLSSSSDQVLGENDCDLWPPPVPAARFSGCTTSAPSQADVD